MRQNQREQAYPKIFVHRKIPFAQPTHKGIENSKDQNSQNNIGQVRVEVT